MPMEDYIDERCPFCRSYLTDLDGVWECQEGCGAYESIQTNGEIIWLTSIRPFMGHYEMQQDREVYNSNGQLIAGELYQLQGQS